MPIHDWTRVRANRFHDFHQSWMLEIRNVLNAGLLPEGYLALAEQITGGPEPDVVTLSLPDPPVGGFEGGISLAAAPVKTRFHTQAEMIRYSNKRDIINIYHPDGDVVAVIEIVSPGNKGSRDAIKAFTQKAVRFIRRHINLLIVDLFPPTKRDPQGIHKRIWDRIEKAEFALPADKQLTLVAYLASDLIEAFIEPVAVGDALPDMPIFLDEDRYILCPLEQTYRAAWEMFPRSLRAPLEAPGT